MREAEFKADFEKIFNPSEAEIKIFSGATVLPLFGDGLEAFGVPLVAMGIMPYTMAAVRKREDDRIRIREYDSVTEYVCTWDALQKNPEKGLPGELFSLLGRICVQETGADILLYQHRIEAVASHLRTVVALGAYWLQEKPLVAEEFLHSVGGVRTEESACLFSCKNTITITDGKHTIRYGCPVQGFKMILLLPEHIKTKRGIFSKPEADSEAWKSFAQRELQRIETAKRCLHQNDRKGISALLKASAQERLHLLGKKAHAVEQLFQLAVSEGVVCALYRDMGVASLVRDEEVDSFIEKIHFGYQKKAGELPAFLICDSADTKLSDIKAE